MLCGSCDNNYGNKPGGECIECRSRATTYLIVSIVAAWQLVLLAFTIRSALNSIRDMRDMRSIVAQNGGTVQQLPSRYQITLAANRSTNSIGGSSKTFSFKGFPTEQKDSFKEEISQKSVNSGSVQVNVQARGQTPIDHIIAAETVSETIKVVCFFCRKSLMQHRCID